MIQCVYCDQDGEMSSQDIQTLSQLHYGKIDISDAIYVVNAGGYIGESTQGEIDYARLHNKEVLFLEPIN